MPTISIIVPVYKVEPYLRQCADSILAQSFTDFELILVDDGSPDNCSAICDEYAEKDERVRVIHQENGGLSAARNAGIDIASGEYLTFIDSDDMVSPRYCEALYSSLIRSNSLISMCMLHEFTNDSELIIEEEDSFSEYVISGRDACLRRYGKGNEYVFIVACGKLYHHSLFYSTRFPVGRIHEDEATIPPILYSSGELSVIDAKLYLYRRNRFSIMGRGFSIDSYDTIYGLDTCLEYFRQHKDKKLVSAVTKMRERMLVLFYFAACQQGIASKIPINYQMNKTKLLVVARKHLYKDAYNWLLMLHCPRIAKLRILFYKTGSRCKAILRRIISFTGR